MNLLATALLALAVGAAPAPNPASASAPVSAPAAGPGSASASVSESLPRRGVLGASFSSVPPQVAADLKLQPEQGAVAGEPMVGLTAERAGLKPGDVVLSLNGIPVRTSTIAATVRGLPSGKPLVISVLRDGKPLELTTTLLEKARDPGNANYEVVYDHVVSNGQRMRTILTKPRKPGRYPALMFIQGFSPVSYDYTLETATGNVATIDGPILFEFANSGFVTMRVEKPGVGDSEGGPFADLDYTTELDIYRKALAQLKTTSGVDNENVFIFGHSMGGAFGPMIATESPVKGIAVYGAAARTWFEYLMDTIRYQGLVGGESFENADEKVRLGARLMALIFLENRSVAEVKQSHPDLAQFADAFFPGGQFSGKTLDFWRQLQQTNFATYWAQCDAHVLSVRGASDFVTYDADHKLIADIVNRTHPGRGKFVLLPDSDHLFHGFKTEAESMKFFQRGVFNPAFTRLMKDWITDLMKDPAEAKGA